MLRTNLEQLQQALQRSREADTAVSKEVKEQRLRQEIAGLKELECERQRDMELLTEAYETKKC